MDFNPHSRAGSDNGFKKALYWSKISIHTPVQGVTANHHKKHLTMVCKNIQKNNIKLKPPKFKVTFAKITSQKLLPFHKFKSANTSTKICSIHIRTIIPMVHLHQNSALHQYVQPYFCNYFPNNKISDYPHLYL